MCKFCWALLAVMILVLAGGAYKFMIQGDTAAGTDGRTALQLNEAERDLVLSEMRAFLVSVQQITKGIAENDMNLVAEYASRAGRAAQQDVPMSLMGKLPIGFKKMGLATHAAFDQLALDAREFGDRDQTLSALHELMNNCVACHAAYRIDTLQGH
jgi:cytochrome c556